MKTNKSATPERKVGSRKLDLLYLMNRIGIKSVRRKLIIGGLLLTGLSIVLTCVIAYRSFYTAIDSSDHLRKMAVSTAETVDMLILENIQFVRSIASDPAIMAKAEWGASENNRRARYYTLTTAGRKRLAVEQQEFDRMVGAIQRVLTAT